MKISKISLVILIIVLISCKKEVKITDTNQKVEVKAIELNYDCLSNRTIKSITHSCGGGCAITYNEKNISIDDSSIKVEYDGITYINERIEEKFSGSFYVKCNSQNKADFVYYKDEPNENILDVKVNSISESFQTYSDELCSCLKEEKNIEIENIVGHTFFRIDTINSIKVLKQPCNANLATFRFYKDSIYHNWGQEVERFSIINSFKKEGCYNFIRKFEPKNEIYKIKPIDKEKNYWLINGEVFIDSLYIFKIEKIEQPCIECWDKETCNEYAREQEFKKWNLQDKAIKKWKGEYLFYFENESADLRTHVNFKIKIKKDSILFSRQRYGANFDYLCYANQKKDTFFLYYYRTLDEEIKLNNYEKYLAKFYINKSKYYIKSNEIDESGKIFEIKRIK